MEGILLLAVIALIVLPIASVCMLSGLGRRMGNVESALEEIRMSVQALKKRENLPKETPVVEESPAPPALPIPQMPPTGEPALPPIPDLSPAPSFASEVQSVSAMPEKPLPPPLPESILADPAPIQPSVEHWSPKFPPVPAPKPKPWQPQPAAEPTWFETQTQRLLTWLLKEGNIWVTAGVVILLVGFGLLFSYMAQMGWFSLELRLASSAVVGIAMAAFGWKLREEKRTYALILQGGGIGVLYIVLLAGAKLGGPVIPIPVAVVGMVLLSAFTVVLALLQNFEPLALFALLGGFAAPLLVRTDSGNHVALFSIYSLLNLEILAISTRRDWRKSRWGGMIASIVVGSVWGVLSWREEYFASVEPFIVLFFLTYSGIASIPFVPRFKDGARFDFPLAATLPFAFLFLQMAAASHTKYGIALTCLGMGAWYLALGQFALKKATVEIDRNMPRVFLGYCILFSNLAIPFIFKQAVSSTVWALEGAFLIVVAAHNRKQAALAWGIALHVAALVLYNFAPYMHLPDWLYPGQSVPVGLLNWESATSPFLLTGLLFALSAFVSSYFVERCEFSGESKFAFGKMEIDLPSEDILTWAFSVYGTAWWWLAVNYGIFTSLGKLGESNSTWLSAFTILSAGAAVAFLLSKHFGWRAIRVLIVPSLALVLLSGWGFGYSAFYGGSPVYGDIWRSPLFNWAVFSLAFLSAFYVYRDEQPKRGSHFAWGVILFAWLFFTGAVFERWIGVRNGDWALLISFLPVLGVAFFFTLDKFEAYCSMEGYEEASRAAIALMLLLTFPSFFSSFVSQGSGLGSVYIPLLNPLELWQFAFLAALLMLLRKLELPHVRRIAIYYVLPALVFLWVNQIAARASWWYFDERIRFGYMSDAPHFQAIIAMLWGLTSLALIYWGKKIPHRTLWFMGAALLALDIAKLLLIDLRNSATIIRIFAFLLLGGLFLLIGWMAPLPPKSTATRIGDEEV